MSKYKFVVGFPTLNEAENISSIVQTIDSGIESSPLAGKVLLLNLDSNSSDGTRDRFGETLTKSDKLAICVTGETAGKGVNILRLVDFAIKENIPGIGMFDADIRSATPDWFTHLAEPVWSMRADFVSPIYTRNPYEGSTTNHFCVPLIEHLFVISPSQPIGGDFAFSLDFAKLVDHSWKSKWAYQYGIDIFLTLTAIINSQRICEVNLGRKVHSPSFSKMVPMFTQVSAAMLSVISSHRDELTRVTLAIQGNGQENGVNVMPQKPSEDSIRERYQFAIYKLHDIRKNNLFHNNFKQILDGVSRNRNVINKKTWESFLGIVLEITLEHNLSEDQILEIIEIILPIFLLRVLSSYNEIDSQSSSAVRKILKYKVQSA